MNTTRGNAALITAAIIEFMDLHGPDNVTITEVYDGRQFSAGKYGLNIANNGYVTWQKNNFNHHDDSSRPSQVEPGGTTASWFCNGDFKGRGAWKFTGALQ